MLIVWDYFGVLAQDAFWYTADRIAAGKGMSGHMHEMQAKADLGQISWDQYCAEISKDIGVSFEDVKERYKHHDIKPDVAAAIRSNKGRHVQVLLSNASHSYLLPIMHDLGLDALFDEIFVSSSVGFAKPDPRAFRNVLEHMDAVPQESLMIDDSARNIASAAEIGMKTIHYRKGINITQELDRLLT